MLNTALSRFPRLELIPEATALHPLPRLSRQLGRELWIKRDDLTPLGLGGNKARKLEYLGGEALAQNTDVLVTAGAIQSNHVRQTAALAARLGLDCLALLENPIDTRNANYHKNGNALLLDLFGTQIERVDSLDNADGLLQAACARLKENGRSPYLVPVGGSNPLGALGYVRGGLELAGQMAASGKDFAAVLVASGSAGTQAGLALALASLRPGTRLIGVTVSRTRQAQQAKVQGLLQKMAELLGLPQQDHPIELWDSYFSPGYGEPNAAGLAAIRLLAGLEGILLDPVYTGKAFAGLLDGLAKGAFAGDGPLLFVHTGGAPALFGYQTYISEIKNK